MGAKGNQTYEMSSFNIYICDTKNSRQYCEEKATQNIRLALEKNIPKCPK